MRRTYHSLIKIEESGTLLRNAVGVLGYVTVLVYLALLVIMLDAVLQTAR